MILVLSLCCAVLCYAVGTNSSPMPNASEKPKNLTPAKLRTSRQYHTEMTVTFEHQRPKQGTYPAKPLITTWATREITQSNSKPCTCTKRKQAHQEFWHSSSSHYIMRLSRPAEQTPCTKPASSGHCDRESDIPDERAPAIAYLARRRSESCLESI